MPQGPQEARVPFRVLPKQISHETVDCLEHLLGEARAGRMVGIAFCAQFRERRYLEGTAGEATRSPTFTLGMLQVLMHKLCKLVDG